MIFATVAIRLAPPQRKSAMLRNANARRNVLLAHMRCSMKRRSSSTRMASRPMSAWPLLETSAMNSLPGARSSERSFPESVTAYNSSGVPLGEALNQTSLPSGNQASVVSSPHCLVRTVFLPFKSRAETKPRVSPGSG
jgi:hypothetical protein